MEPRAVARLRSTLTVLAVLALGAPCTCTASTGPPPPPLDELVRTSASVFSGVVVEIGPSLLRKQTYVEERRIPVPPWERASRIRFDGVDIPYRTKVDTLVTGTAIGSRDPHLVTLSVTAQWKGAPVDTARVVSRGWEKVGQHWLVFTTEMDSFSLSYLRVALDSLGWRPEVRRHGSTPIDLAGNHLYHLDAPVWRDEARSPWPLVIDDLIRQVREGDTETALTAARQLVETCERKEEVAIALAVLLTRAESDSVAKVTARLMADLREETLPWLGAALNHPRPAVRRGAIYGMQYLHWDAYTAIGILRAKLRDPDPKVREVTAEIFNAFEVRAAPAYEELLLTCADSVRAVRSISAAAIGLIGPRDERALVTLLSLLHDPDPGVRMSAGNALGFLGVDTEAVRAALYNAMRNDPHRAGREGAQIGLRRLDGYWRERQSFEPRGTPSWRPCDPPDLRRTWNIPPIPR